MHDVEWPDWGCQKSSGKNVEEHRLTLTLASWAKLTLALLLWLSTLNQWCKSISVQHGLVQHSQNCQGKGPVHTECNISHMSVIPLFWSLLLSLRWVWLKMASWDSPTLKLCVRGPVGFPGQCSCCCSKAAKQSTYITFCWTIWTTSEEHGLKREFEHNTLC